MALSEVEKVILVGNFSKFLEHFDCIIFVYVVESMARKTAKLPLDFQS